MGVSVLFTVSKMDAGPIISQKEETIDENDTHTTVLPFLFDVGTDLLIDAMPDLVQGKITMETATAQDEDAVVHADMIDSAEAEFKPWEESARTMHNRLRGFSMWPGAFLYLQVGTASATKYKILETRVLPDKVEPTDAVVRSLRSHGLAAERVIDLGRAEPAAVHRALLEHTTTHSSVVAVGNMGGQGAATVDYFARQSRGNHG